ncbi:DUF4347 domain-containing protein [Tundrisphaera lichenicola]|uniref:DUF4347 domain-containing protein n=1 Tax=Tundrisphaera lichenicola TaxID=2029860 RepID=UPI003EBCCAA8
MARLSVQAECLESRTLLTRVGLAPQFVMPLPASATPAATPLRVALINTSVVQADQVAQAADPGVIALTYDGRTTDTAGLVSLLESLSASHGGAKIEELGLVSHGSEARVSIGGGDSWSLSTLTSDGTSLSLLRGLLTDDARFDLYSCSVAAGPDGKALINQIAALTGADVYASTNPVGSGSLGDFTWEYSTNPGHSASKLLSNTALESIANLKLDDLYEDNDSKAIVDARTAGAANSPNLGPISGLVSIPGLALNDTADWYKFQTAGVATTDDYVSLSFDYHQGDVDLYVYRANGTTLVDRDAGDNDYYGFNDASISLSGQVAGTYYIKVIAHSTAACHPTGIGSYTLTVTAPTAASDDAYEDNDTKNITVARPEGAANSPNLGLRTSALTISNLALVDNADWFKFQTGFNGVSGNSVSINFDTSLVDLDLYL